MTRPGEESPSAPRRALAAYALRSPASQADIDRVMRALVEHDGWYVPVLFAESAWGQTKFDQMLLFADAAQSPVLTVFTDHESALLADGQPLGVYGGPVSGVQLMRSLTNGFNALIVNPASPREHQWYVASGGFQIAADWSTAVTVERALAERGQGPLPTAELLAHRYHLLLDRAAHEPVQTYVPDMEGAVAVCFTATDRVGEFLASLPAGPRAQAALAPIGGPQLFDTMRGASVLGLVVNAGSSAQTALFRDDLAELAGVRKVER